MSALCPTLSNEMEGWLHTNVAGGDEEIHGVVADLRVTPHSVLNNPGHTSAVDVPLAHGGIPHGVFVGLINRQGACEQ